MSVANSQQIARYYDFFRDKEVVFTKANLKYLRMDPRQIYVKCNGGQWPCILNSSSLQKAKIIIGTQSGILKEINKNKEAPVSIRYCFFDQNNAPVQFFVNCDVTEVKNYQGSNDLAMLTLTFTQRPPDDLISRIGEFLEVNQNFATRKEERIAINKNTLRELGIPKEESVIFVQAVPRKCILKDLSFGGARVMTVGVPKFLENKPVTLMLLFSETQEKVSLPGVVRKCEFLEGRKDIVNVHIEFNPDDIPMSYKFHINSFITSYQKKIIQNQMQNRQAMIKAEEEAAAKKKRIEEMRAAQAAKANESAANSETQTPATVSASAEN